MFNFYCVSVLIVCSNILIVKGDYLLNYKESCDRFNESCGEECTRTLSNEQATVKPFPIYMKTNDNAGKENEDSDAANTPMTVPVLKSIYEGNMAILIARIVVLIEKAGGIDNFELHSNVSGTLEKVSPENCPAPNYVYAIAKNKNSNAGAVFVVSNNVKERQCTKFKCENVCEQHNLSNEDLESLKSYARGFTVCCRWDDFLKNIENPPIDSKKLEFTELLNFSDAYTEELKENEKE